MSEFEQMKRREIFAAMALQGILFWDATMNDRVNSGKVDQLADQAVNMADALIEALEKEPKQ